MTTILICLAVYLVGVLIVGRMLENPSDALIAAILWPLLFAFLAAAFVFIVFDLTLEKIYNYIVHPSERSVIHKFFIRLITGRKP